MFPSFQWADLESSVRLTSVALNFGFCKQGLVTGSFKSLKKKKKKDKSKHTQKKTIVKYSTRFSNFYTNIVPLCH